jgi:hypothetical protein
MKIPKIFIPEKNLEQNVETLLNPKKLRAEQIFNILSLTYTLPENIEMYKLRTDFEIINKKDYGIHFGKRLHKHIIRAGQMTYKIPFSIFFTTVYALEFKNGTDLNKLNKEINLKKEINRVEDVTKTRCLEKNNYLIAISSNKLEEYSFDVFRTWYLNNFGLEVL